MSSRLTTLLLIAVLAIVIISSSIFTVDVRERALLLRLGHIERSDYPAGLHFKLPFINEVRKFDGRILTLDATPARYLTGEKKNVLVDSFILWRVSDVATYFRSMGGDERRAESRLSQIIKDNLRGEFGKRTIQEVVSGDRSAIETYITKQANVVSSEFGIEVVNVKIKRIDLPTEVSTSVYSRMEAERERVAKELRSRGAEQAERIRSDADRERTILLADARRDAEVLRGKGDAVATEIYATAYEKNTEFYSLYRRLSAYKDVFTEEDMLIIEPKGEFFNNFDNANDK